jgi:hypothetical protein
MVMMELQKEIGAEGKMLRATATVLLAIFLLVKSKGR